MVILVPYSLIGGAVSVGVGAWLVFTDDAAAKSMVPLAAAASVGGLLLADYAAGLLQGAGRVRSGMWIRQSVGLGQSAVAVLMIAAGVRDPGAILAGMAIWAWACGVTGLISAGTTHWVATPRPLRATVTRLAHIGVRTQAIWILLLLNYRVDIGLLGALGSVGETGVYSVAVGFGEAAWLVVNAIVAILLPHLSGIAPTLARDRAATAVRVSVLATTVSAAALTAGLWAFAVPVFGAGFERVPLAFLLLVPGLVMLASFKVLAIYAIGSGETRVVTRLALLGLIANVTANVVLIPPLGSLGAAAASSISYSFIAVWALAWFARFSPPKALAAGTGGASAFRGAPTGIGPHT
jgi:O-antigen/teichoic acid export membrane protein